MRKHQHYVEDDECLYDCMMYISTYHSQVEGNHNNAGAGACIVEAEDEGEMSP